MSDPTIEEIAARERVATPGPWKWREWNEPSWPGAKPAKVTTRNSSGWSDWVARHYVILLQRQGRQVRDIHDGHVLSISRPARNGNVVMSLSEEDAEFIAHSREDVRFLLERCRALEEDLRRRSPNAERD